jgi:hypothetical protein
MNGPQIKAVLERGYRNYYYYYKYVSGFGGYSYYTTCMLDTNKVGQITYDQKAGGASTPRSRTAATSSPSRSTGRRSTSPMPPGTTTSQRSTTWPPAPATSTTAA